MGIMFNTQREYQIWIVATILIFSLIGKDFTFLISSFWIGWTVSKVKDKKINLIIKQLVIILAATILGTIIGYTFSLVHLLELKGWI
jgi:hypothetical protein